MAERQIHGFNYQSKIIQRELLKEDINYTGKWDAVCTSTNLPASIKCISVKGSIDFGDFRRQTQVDQDFILYVGFWEKSRSNIVEEYKVLIKSDIWQSYFGDKTIIESMINDMKLISNDRKDDQIWREFREKYSNLYGDSIISLRFKRDHKKQKRIQCGITKNNFIKFVIKDNLLLDWK